MAQRQDVIPAKCNRKIGCGNDAHYFVPMRGLMCDACYTKYILETCRSERACDNCGKPATVFDTVLGKVYGRRCQICHDAAQQYLEDYNAESERLIAGGMRCCCFISAQRCPVHDRNKP